MRHPKGAVLAILQRAGVRSRVLHEVVEEIRQAYEEMLEWDEENGAEGYRSDGGDRGEYD